MIIFRAFAEEDIDSIKDIYNHYVLNTPITFDLKPFSKEEMKNKIELNNVSHCCLVSEEEGRITGYAYGSTYRSKKAYQRTVETTIYTVPESHGRGLGRKLYQKLLQTLTLQGYKRALAGITVPNKVSEKLHNNLGFSKVGIFNKTGYKFGNWHSVSWWQMDLSEDTEPLQNIISFSEIQELSEWQNLMKT